MSRFSKFLAQEENNEFCAKRDLSNVKAFMHSLDDPQNSFFSIHIAGSNGKGSVANFLAAMLKGYNVGLYTSPHVIEFRERIKVNGNKIPKKKLLDLFNQLYEEGKKYSISSFELATAIAFKYFEEEKIDFGVVECGLGGRLDATNVLENKISIITNIALEHTGILGNSLQSIAKEKAGIIGKDSVLFTFEEKPRILKIFEKECKKNKSELVSVNPKLNKDYGFEVVAKGDSYLEVDFYTPNAYYSNIRLAAFYQAQNALLSIAVAEYLKQNSLANISSSTIANAIEQTQILGRFNILSKDPLFVVDVAHNSAGIKALVESLSYYGKNFRAVFACSADKDARSMLKILGRICDEIVVTEFQNKRTANKNKLLKISKSLRCNVKQMPISQIKKF